MHQLVKIKYGLRSFSIIFLIQNNLASYVLRVYPVVLHKKRMNILTIIFLKIFEKETVLTHEMTFSRVFLIAIQLKTKETSHFFYFHEGTKRKNHSSKDYQIK